MLTYAIPTLNDALAGRYSIERELGRGGMATVYLARDLKHDRPVALKVLDPELGAVLGAERFLTEIRVTANLQHPHLLPLFDSGEAGGLLFYVMPYVEGESLRARLDREKQLPVDDALRIAVAVADALEFAHQCGVIHRDLKPENILLQHTQPVVADFGIALAVSNAGGKRITQSGLSLGTPQYMSPEQASADRALDGRTDIYSLGAVIYEMLTGDPPHTGSTAQAIISRVLTEEPRPIRASRPSVPAHVASAVERALAKLPADRFATPRDFADALMGPGVSLPEGVSTPGAIVAATRRSRGLRVALRDPAAIGLTIAALGVVGGVAAGAWIALRHAAPPRRAVRFELGLGDLHVVNTGYPVISISPDGRRVALLAEVQGRRQIYLRSLDELTMKPVAGTEGAAQPIFAPDGKWLAFIGMNDGRLKKVRVDGGAVVTIADSGAALPGPGMTWSKSGVIVAIGRFSALGLEPRDREGLVAIPDDGGRPRLISEMPARPFFAPGTQRKFCGVQPVALPDGETVLCSARQSVPASEDAPIAALSLRSGKLTTLEPRATKVLGVVEGALVYATASGAIMAVPFDVQGVRTTGASVPLVDHVFIPSTSGAARAAVSESGTLVYEETPEGQLVLADTKRGARSLLPESRMYETPRFSPDGKRVAVVIRSGIEKNLWIYDIAAGTLTRLSDGRVDNYPEWTPDGRRLVFASRRSAAVGGGLRQAYWWQPADGSGPAELLVQPAQNTQFDATFTPDGRTLVFATATEPSRRSELYYRRIDGTDTTTRLLDSNGFYHVSPEVSPDGHWLAYSSNESGSFQIYVRPFPGQGPRVQVSVDGGSSPVWSRDETRLYYAGNKQLIAANVVTRPTFAVTGRQVVFDGGYAFAGSPRTFDVSPDGRQFLLLKRDAAEAPIIVVHDWAAELRSKLEKR